MGGCLPSLQATRDSVGPGGRIPSVSSPRGRFLGPQPDYSSRPRPFPGMSGMGDRPNRFRRSDRTVLWCPTFKLNIGHGCTDGCAPNFRRAGRSPHCPSVWGSSFCPSRRVRPGRRRLPVSPVSLSPPESRCPSSKRSDGKVLTLPSFTSPTRPLFQSHRLSVTVLTSLSWSLPSSARPGSPVCLSRQRDVTLSVSQTRRESLSGREGRVQDRLRGRVSVGVASATSSTTAS